MQEKCLLNSTGKNCASSELAWNEVYFQALAFPRFSKTTLLFQCCTLSASKISFFQSPTCPVDKSSLQSSNLPYFHLYSVSVYQSSSLPVLQSSILLIFQALNPFSFHPLLFQSYTMSIVQQFSLPFFQFVLCSLLFFQFSSLLAS